MADDRPRIDLTDLPPDMAFRLGEWVAELSKYEEARGYNRAVDLLCEELYALQASVDAPEGERERRHTYGGGYKDGTQNAIARLARRFDLVIVGS